MTLVEGVGHRMLEIVAVVREALFTVKLSQPLLTFLCKRENTVNKTQMVLASANCSTIMFYVRGNTELAA